MGPRWWFDGKCISKHWKRLCDIMWHYGSEFSVLRTRSWLPGPRKIKRVGIYSCGFSRLEFKFQSFYFCRLIVFKLQMLSVILFSETSKSLFCSILIFLLIRRNILQTWSIKTVPKVTFPFPTESVCHKYLLAHNCPPTWVLTRSQRCVVGCFLISGMFYISAFSITVPFWIVQQSRVADPPDGAEIGCLSQVTLALAGCDKEVQKK